MQALYRLFFLFIFSLVMASCGQDHPDESQPRFSEEELQLLDEIRETSILQWTPEMQLLGYKNTPEVSPVRYMTASADPYPLTYAEEQIEEVFYMYDSGVRSLEDYLEQMNVAGLLVLKDDEILLEYYGYDNNEESRWISFSVTKSVLSMLYGIALEQGYFTSLDDEVTDYLPQLEGSAYEGVTLEHILWMSSGVAWNEDYTDPESDVAALEHINTEEELIRYMAGLQRQSQPGTRFNYNTGETNLAGAILKAATGAYPADLASEYLWQPFGMEHDSPWALMGEDDLEHGGCCISATLRDYGRIGLVALRNGETAGGTRLLPEDWMQRSVQPSPGLDGYGYYWWLNNDSDGTYAASGIYGQHIHVNPEKNLVIAMHGKWEQATGSERSAHRRAFIRGLTEAAQDLGESTCCSENR